MTYQSIKKEAYSTADTHCHCPLPSVASFAPATKTYLGVASRAKNPPPNGMRHKHEGPASALASVCSSAADSHDMSLSQHVHDRLRYSSIRCGSPCIAYIGTMLLW